LEKGAGGVALRAGSSDSSATTLEAAREKGRTRSASAPPSKLAKVDGCGKT